MTEQIDNLLITRAEEWKNVPGYEHYEISNLGRVRKTAYLSVFQHHGEYPAVQLFKGDGFGGKSKTGRGGSKKANIHRLLAELFIPNPDNLPCVNHKDGNKSNHSLDNLEWCSYSENMKHAYDNYLIGRQKVMSNRMVVELNEQRELVKVWNGVRALRESGRTWNKVYDSIRRGVKYRGNLWEYLDFHFSYHKEAAFEKTEGGRRYLSQDELTAAVLTKYATSAQYLEYLNQQSK